MLEEVYHNGGNMANINNPCSMCADNPYWCRGACRDKQKYINQGNRLVIDKNKNGIRREKIKYGKKNRSR